MTATTRSDENGHRQTYVYVHDLLYPLYAQLPTFLDKEQRHQYLVFASDESLTKLVTWLKSLANALSYPNGSIAIAIVNSKSEQSRKVLERCGEIVGPDWTEFNKSQCLRITLPRSKGQTDLQASRLHMTIARLLLSRVDALVGYKYCNGINNNPKEDIWVAKKWNEDQRVVDEYRVLPKRLAEPINRLIKKLSDLRESHNFTAA